MSRRMAFTLVAGCIAFASPSLLPAASTAYHDAVAASTPLLHYRLNELAGNALNYGSLGAGFDAAYFGTPTRGAVTAEGDGGVGFDAAEDYLESLSVAPLDLTGNPTFSAEAVFRVPPAGGAGLWAPFLHWGPSPAGDGGPTAKSVYFSFSNNDATEAFAGFYNGGLQTPGGSVAKGRWHHYVWVRTGGGSALVGTKVYLDGVDVTASLAPDPDLPANALTPIVEATEFRINRARDYETLRYFVGTLDELALFDRALDSAEVMAHYVAFANLFSDDFETMDICRWAAAVPSGSCDPP